MTLIDFPASVDTFTDPDAGAGDKLDTPGVEHDGEHSKKNAAITALQRITVGPTYVNLTGSGGVGNGAGNDSIAITNTLNEASDGAIVRAPVGEYMVDPSTMSLVSSRRIEGDGQESTWFTLISDTSGAALEVNIAGGGPSRRTQYGPGIRGIGINLANAPSATGLKFGANTAWVHVDDILIIGGAVSFDSLAPNCKITNFHFLNPSVTFVRAVQAGLELHLYDGKLEVSPGVTVPNLMDISVATGGIKGAVYLRQIECNNIGTVNRGIYVHCPDGSTASLPLRCTMVTLDNLAGPGYDLVNVTDAEIFGGWVNSAAGTTNGAIRFYGGGGHTVIGQQQLNGGTSGGCTFDFAGATPAGIVLLGNAPATAVYYRISATGKPSELFIADRTAAAAVISQVTNDPEALRLACATRLWTPQVHAQRLYVRETGTNPPAGYEVLVAGAKTIAHTGVATNTRVRVTRERPGGTVGELYCSVVDNVVGTSFTVRSTSATDTSAFYWEMYDPA